MRLLQSLPLTARIGFSLSAQRARLTPERGEKNDPQVSVAAVGSARCSSERRHSRRDNDTDHRQQTTPSPTEQAAAQRRAGTRRRRRAGRHRKIVITAQGRRQILQDVPIAVTAVGGDEMKNSGATDIRQLNQLAPSLLVSSTGTEANGSARIRGIGTVGDNPGLESSVAVFIDGVYRSRSGIGLNELGEIDRVEVLRGPQGTLFGRNASAGLIHIITKKPTFTPDGLWRSDLRQLRLIAACRRRHRPARRTRSPRGSTRSMSKRDGFYTSSTRPADRTDVNNRNRFFTRGQLLFQPNDELSVRLIGDYTRAQRKLLRRGLCRSTREVYDPTPGVPGDFATATSNRIVNVLTLPSAASFRRRRSLQPQPLGHAGPDLKGKTKDWGVSGQVDYDLGGANLTSITAYRDYKSYGAGDIDYSTVDILYRADDGNAYRQFKTFTPGTAASGHRLRRQARLAGRRLLRQREPRRSRQSAVRQPIWRLRGLPHRSPELRSLRQPSSILRPERSGLHGHDAQPRWRRSMRRWSAPASALPHRSSCRRSTA